MSNDFFTTSNRIKSTPFSSRNQKAGVKKHSVYNNTLIPTIFKSLKSDYLHLIKHVQIMKSIRLTAHRSIICPTIVKHLKGFV